jgi:glycine cleavage system H protein
MGSGNSLIKRYLKVRKRGGHKMEGFTYVDIFATKGLEYLLVISVLALFIPFWRMVSKPTKAMVESARNIIPAIGEWFHVPEDNVYYHQGHSWAIPENDNLVRVGIDDFAQKLLGRIDTIRLPQVGSHVTQGEKGWNLLIGSKSVDMLSPVDGRVVEINESLLRAPEGIGRDPYGHGWLMKVEAPGITANLKNLLSDGLAIKWMEGVKNSLLARTNYNLGAVSQDGGVPVDGIARHLDRERWDEIVNEYFLTS